MKTIQKIGSVTKTSESSPTPPQLAKRDSLAFVHPLKLFSISHYHAPDGVHPRPVCFSKRIQCIEVVTGGRGWVEAEGKWVEVTPGHILWHVAGDYTIGRNDLTDPYRCLAVRFAGPPHPARPVPHITRWDDIDEVRHFTREVIRLVADDSFDSTVLLRYILARISFQATLHCHQQARHSLPVELSRVVGEIDLHYAQALRLQDLARSAGWSVAHLHDRFKEHLGLSPHQALIRRRIQAARELLSSSNEPIKSIAGKCGFPTAASFCVQFKKTTQLSPKEYRKRQHYG